MPRLSIIVPLMGDAQAWEETLVAVLQNRPDDCEILVPFAGPYDDPYQLGEEIRFVEAPQGAGRVGLLAAALAHCWGEVVHILLPGALVEEGWADAALAHFERRQVASVASLLVDADHPDRLIAAGVAYGAAGSRKLCGAGKRLEQAERAARRARGPTLQGAFYRRSTLQQIGGLSLACGDSLADLETAMTLQATGAASPVEPACMVYCRDRATERSDTFRAGLGAERLFWRNAGAVGWIRSLAMHAAAVTAEALTAPIRPRRALRLMGRLCAFFEAPLHIVRGAQRSRARMSPEPVRSTSVIPAPHFDSPRVGRSRKAAASGL